ncbi:hypothetical protein ACFHWD_03760 [Clostridium sp. MT-14]|uniref:hypothetical protein n=1 Tax=Clostridium sp. MT-14 TaxID=3348360 RepID=UPI0035F309FE
MSFNDGLLRGILGCGTMELEKLNDCKYDPFNVIEECKINFKEINFDNIIDTIFREAQRNLSKSIQNKISELDESDSEKQRELREIQKLNLYEDIEYSINGIDTYMSFRRNGDIYNKYFKDKLKEIEGNTGFNVFY